MKLLVVGAYRDGSGWSQACLDFIQAANSVKIDTVCRPIRFNTQIHKLPKEVEEIEKKSTRDADCIVYFIPPHHIRYHSKFRKNICYVFTEIISMEHNDWIPNLQLMDEVWVPDDNTKKSLLAGGLTKPIKVVPCAVNTDKYMRSYPKNKFIEENKNGNFLFYTIVDMNKRKNISGLLKAFHLEFSPNEPVNLLIKCSKVQVAIENYKIPIEECCRQVKEGMKLFLNESRYKKELAYPEKFCSEEEILSIHQDCDCFVLPSYGEGWCLPAFDAMAFGKTPIVTENAFPNYLSEQEGYLAYSNIEQVFGMQALGGEMYSSYEQWFGVDINDLRKCMRSAYENKSLRQKKSEAGIIKAFDYSYENIGALIKRELE